MRKTIFRSILYFMVYTVIAASVAMLCMYFIYGQKMPVADAVAIGLGLIVGRFIVYSVEKVYRQIHKRTEKNHEK